MSNVQVRTANYFEIEYREGEKRLYLSAINNNPRDAWSRSLQLRSDTDTGWFYLSLYNEQLKVAKDPTEWLEGNKAFRINCYVKPSPAEKRDVSYLIIRKTVIGKVDSQKQPIIHYSVHSVAAGKIKNKADGELMQFKLEPIPDTGQGQRATPTQLEPSVPQQPAAAASVGDHSHSRSLNVTAEMHPH